MKLNIKIMKYSDEGSIVMVQSENNILEFGSLNESEDENNNLRYFCGAYSIEELIKEAYNAGKNGEELNVTIKKVNLTE